MTGRRSLWRSRDASTSPPRRKLKATNVAAPEPGGGIQDLSRPTSDCPIDGKSLASLGIWTCAYITAIELTQTGCLAPLPSPTSRGSMSSSVTSFLTCLKPSVRQGQEDMIFNVAYTALITNWAPLHTVMPMLSTHLRGFSRGCLC